MYYAGWQMIAEYNGAGSLQRKYVYGPGIDEPVRMTSTGGAGTNYFYHADGLGSVTEITGTTGQLVECYRYDVYGTPTFYNAAGSPLSASAISNRLLFTGRDRDPDTTWYNYRHRYYNPTLGRLVQPDPIRIAGGHFNLYVYTRNAPGTWRDPLGLDTTLQWTPSVLDVGPFDATLTLQVNPSPDNPQFSVVPGASLQIGDWGPQYSWDARNGFERLEGFSAKFDLGAQKSHLGLSVPFLLKCELKSDLRANTGELEVKVGPVDFRLSRNEKGPNLVIGVVRWLGRMGVPNTRYLEERLAPVFVE
jgi:RHS repeat-associated protein